MTKEVMVENETELIFLQNLRKYISDNPECKFEELMKAFGVIS